MKKDFVILHMAGQSEQLGYAGLSAGESAKALGVSKPTALKYMDRLVEAGMLYKRSVYWRSNAKKYVYILTQKSKPAYKAGDYKPAYLDTLINVNVGTQMELF